MQKLPNLDYLLHSFLFIVQFTSVQETHASVRFTTCASTWSIVKHRSVSNIVSWTVSKTVSFVIVICHHLFVPCMYLYNEFTKIQLITDYLHAYFIRICLAEDVPVSDMFISSYLWSKQERDCPHIENAYKQTI